MSNTRTFELIEILSLMNGELYLDVQQKDVHQIVEQIYGPISPESDQYEYVKRVLTEHIAEHHPRLVEAAAIVSSNKDFKRPHYNAMINLFRMRHAIEVMELEIV